MELMEESVSCGIRGDHTEERNVSSSGLQGTDEERGHANAIFTIFKNGYQPSPAKGLHKGSDYSGLRRISDGRSLDEVKSSRGGEEG